jgi:hypothetical protein
MGTRKPNQRSSIFEGADGYWHGYVTVGHKPDGRLDRRHLQAITEAEVTKRVRKLEQDRERGETKKAGRAPTVASWMTTYLDTIAPQRVTPKTLDAYWSQATNWIIPNLGRHRLDRLAPEHLDRLYAVMLDAGRAPSMVLKTHRILSRALKIAHRRGHVNRNVALLVDPPSSPEVEQQQLTLAEARQVLAATAELRNGPAGRWRCPRVCARARRSGCAGSTSTSTPATSRSGGSSSATAGATAATTRTCAASACTGPPVRRTAGATPRPAHSATAAGSSSVGPRARAGARSPCRPASSTRCASTRRPRTSSGSAPGSCGTTRTSCSPPRSAGPSTRAATGRSGRRSCGRPACARSGSTTCATRPGRCWSPRACTSGRCRNPRPLRRPDHAGLTHIGSEVARDAARRMDSALWGDDA